MNRQVVLIVGAILVILAGWAAYFTWQRGPADDAALEPDAVEPKAGGEVSADQELLAVDLYFPGSWGALQAERHELAAGATPAESISAVVAALLAGPRDGRLQAPLPSSVTLRKVYLTAEGTVFLDLESADGEPPPASGSQREVLAVYSLVNTVLLNFDEVERLVLLWNGRQLKTFAGHLDTMRPLKPNTDLIAPAS